MAPPTKKPPRGLPADPVSKEELDARLEEALSDAIAAERYAAAAADAGAVQVGEPKVDSGWGPAISYGQQPAEQAFLPPEARMLAPARAVAPLPDVAQREKDDALRDALMGRPKEEHGSPGQPPVDTPPSDPQQDIMAALKEQIKPGQQYTVGSSSTFQRATPHASLFPAMAEAQQAAAGAAGVEVQYSSDLAGELRDIEQGVGLEVVKLAKERGEKLGAYKRAKEDRLVAIEKLDKAGVSPSQWWYNENNAVTALRLMSVAMGATAQAAGVTRQNQAMGQINRLIDQDIQSQLANIQLDERAVDRKTNTLSMLYRELGDMDAAIATAKAGKLAKLTMAAKKLDVQYGGERAAAGARQFGAKLALDTARQLGGTSSTTKQTRSGASILAETAAKIAKERGKRELETKPATELADMMTSYKAVGRIASKIYDKGYGLLKRNLLWTEDKQLKREIMVEVKSLVKQLEGARPSDFDFKKMIETMDSKYMSAREVADMFRTQMRKAGDMITNRLNIYSDIDKNVARLGPRWKATRTAAMKPLIAYDIQQRYRK